MMVQGMKEFLFETSVSVTSAAPPEVVYDLVADLRSHLDWSGERAASDTFKLLTLDVSEGQATVGTRFASTGANDNGTFHDSSVVTEASRPTRFAFETDSRLERTRGRAWEVHFSHRYDIASDGQGTRIVYTDTVQRVNYVPYWLQPWFRPITRRIIDRADTRQMGNLARAAEERAGD
jgi:Polyketide cyclase / dehydrase and lipid transport